MIHHTYKHFGNIVRKTQTSKMYNNDTGRTVNRSKSNKEEEIVKIFFDDK